jgi:hypothetical protein
LRACTYMLGVYPAFFGCIEAVAEHARHLKEGALGSTLVEEGRIVICPTSSSIIPDPGASQAFVTYFCDPANPSEPYLCPYQVLTSVYLV